MDKKEKLIPELRFKEFEEPNVGNGFQVYRFEDIFQFSTGKNIKQNEASPFFEIPCVRYGELYHMYNEIIHEVINKTYLDASELKFSKGNEILLPSAGEDPLDIGSASALTVENVAIGRTINVLSPKKTGVYAQIYASYYINEKLRKKIATLARGASISNVYNSDLKKLKINLPTLPEQQKIANFLSAVDQKIQQLQRKKELLTQYKKGMIQKLFSQQIRFKDEQGNDFPEWEEKKLGEVFERVKRKNKENNQNVLTISAQRGLVNQIEYFNHSVSAKDLTGYYLLKKGEFAYNKSYSKGFPMGAIKRLDKYDKGVVSTLYICFGIIENDDSTFYKEFLDGGGINHEIHKIAQEGARNHGLLNMSVVEFFKDIVIPRPSVEEQTKISEVLNALSAKIVLAKHELEQAKRFKKGLLQKMFV